MVFDFNAFVLCLPLILIGLCCYVRRKLSYWKSEGVPYVKYKFPFGTAENPLRRRVAVAEEFQNHYNYFKSQGHKYGGLYSFGKPVFLPVHPECIKAIMSTDFPHFMNHGSYYNEKSDPLSAHLFNLEGHRWKGLREKLSYTYTSENMKTMFDILISFNDQLVTAVNKLLLNQDEIDLKEVLACYATDVIGSCAFGIDCKSFNENENYFRKCGRMFFLPLTKLESLRDSVAFIVPELSRYLGISIIKRETTDFFFKAMKEEVEFRKKTNCQRKDLMQLLINLKNVNDGSKEITIEQIAAQAFVFFLASFENPSSTMTFCLLELALNQEIQDKARNEVSEVLANNNEKFSYDSMVNMKYLGQIIDETLRKYPFVPAIPRICVEDYNIPGTNSVVKKGVRVLISTFALHRDPEFFPNPENFDPERFNEVNKPKIRPYSYLPFGEGPRNCIGSRFALMQIKVGLSALLKDFQFTMNEKTTFPVKLHENSFNLLAKDGVWLNVKKL